MDQTCFQRWDKDKKPHLDPKKALFKVLCYHFLLYRLRKKICLFLVKVGVRQVL